MEALTDIKDLLLVQQQITIGAAGGKTRKPKAHPRPKTALTQRTPELSEEQQELMDIFTPKPDSE